ncbi:L,D-transpeptidase family protein [Antarcticibacterium arcticum]|uniref:L,D-transpeptidase family protein n=1 Tax=Antarcticibacterium arcticum TaxID=2585771 RepID=A0A5B8YI22_9FLAO|nr:L,D-transpeptidase family protein [Antarcticibacterium arcticum]QED36253.1 L,D-transpeptidase family protein [Antarcticibacterium arcticum]
MKNKLLNSSNIVNRFLIFSILLISVVSCKKGGNDTYVWYFTDEELGNAEQISALISNPADLNLFNQDSVADFYAHRKFIPAWSDVKLREDFIETLKEAEHEGLYIEDYHGEIILSRIDNLKKLGEKEKSELDILLTDAFLKFGKHLLNGILDPRELHSIWDTPRNKEDLMALLKEVTDKKDLDIAMDKLRPSHLVYKQLIASSKEYNNLRTKSQDWEDIPSGEMIKHNKKDERIPLIQERLKTLNYLDTIQAGVMENNEYVQKAIENFQGDNGLQADGVIGNSTIELLNMNYQKRYEQIQVNLERWRWYPRDLGEHFIIVNIANFNLDVIKDNDTVHRHRTMVGTEARKTPVFSEEIKYLVFNPTWTIPPTIQNDDVIPGMRRNSGYLANKKINVYDSSGNQVDPSGINWNGDDAKRYTYMQNPGASNPLGRVKIMYPNEYFIYLHDTPSQALFERNSRDQSSGCVRVEHAVDLAKYLLSDQEEYSSKVIDDIIAKGTTRQINMKQKVNVHHFYWTAWRENGATRFTADIYDYDRKTYEALRKAS